MDAATYRLIELAEANMAVSFFEMVPTDFAAKYGLYLEQKASYTATLCKAPLFAMYNSVYALGVGAPTTDDDLRHLINLYKQAECTPTVRLSPYALPTNLPDRLSAHGFRQSGSSLKLYRDETTAPPPNVPGYFQIEETGKERAAIFAQIAATGLSAATQEWLAATAGREGWHHYLAYIEGVPVATGTLFTKHGVGQLINFAKVFSTFCSRAYAT